MRKALLAGVAAAALFGAGAGARIFLCNGGEVAVVRHAVDGFRASPAAGMAIGWASEEETKAALVLRTCPSTSTAGRPSRLRKSPSSLTDHRCALPPTISPRSA